MLPMDTQKTIIIAIKSHDNPYLKIGFFQKYTNIFVVARIWKKIRFAFQNFEKL